MADYKAPLRDIRFVLNEVFDAPALWAQLPALQELVDGETADAILEEAAKLIEQEIAPLNRESDEHGSSWEDGVVTEPEGFKAAYEAFCEGGWNGLGGNPEYGGMGMPKMLTAQVEEMLQSGSMSFGLAPMLTAGACLSINAHGSDTLKETYLPNMYSGVWSGAMDLTEPHAGTDLGIIRTRAEDNGDGSYSITGTKIFITWGEHGMAENIIHLVLAKLPDAPPGPKGISLFLVPKFMVNDDGSLGERNQFSCGSIEKKMGIKGSATCVMNYDGAKGWLVGEVNQGLACMFTMMNYERLVVGIQALGVAEMSYQNAVEYARDRIQSRSPAGAVCPDKAADPIIVHPDVRRMLLVMRAQTEGARALSTYVAKWLDLGKYSDDAEQKKYANNMMALLTPVTKAFISDKALETTVLGQQVFGGHGFIREWGQEQLVRDVRITQIYEGTNGVQAMDLVGRKLVANGGAFFADFVADVEAFVSSCDGNAAMQEFIAPLTSELENLKQVTAAVLEQAKGDASAIGAAANDYLHLFGTFSLAYMWALMAKVALEKVDSGEADFYRTKLAVARFFYQRQLPLTKALSGNILAGSDTLMALDADLF
ncbi:acyl-CoA dehydrogenase C-terminal domain-containing protein [Pseudomaricurvus sp. HS19]|uniref:acyl-CoA dehydrogenase C-terminal domain-containing protein n=1 Tax=Pseudomaricurvus sp. HS19 TaxID=2692626 RepID=UPI00136AB9A0|nr:acyl-CoA dehydrogenase C-terminal domain-containing protein [Pseudomaricurvus sp. HS19]MYM64267.1 acyl-CoA dehydrogenase [Pseudomaricurvus sp. HS19]